MEKNEKAVNVEPNLAEEEKIGDEEWEFGPSRVVRFHKPYFFEGKEYFEVDLSAMEDLTGADMIAVNKIMARTSAGIIDIMPEVSLEYACHLAARAAKLPVEFFTQLPPKEAMKIKNRVTAFLFGSD